MTCFNFEGLILKCSSSTIFRAVPFTELLFTASGILTISGHSLTEYCSLLEDFLSTWTIWLHKTLLSSLMTARSASNSSYKWINIVHRNLDHPPFWSYQNFLCFSKKSNTLSLFEKTERAYQISCTFFEKLIFLHMFGQMT